jgi:tricorn protease-like protein
LSPFNSTADEFSPKFSPDGKYFFWSSARSVIDKPSAKKLTYAEILKRFHSPQNGLGDIYSIEAPALKLER